MGTTEARIQHKRDTTAHWNNARGMIPLDGEVIVYTDYTTTTKEIDGVETLVYIPAIKIGDGRAYVQDLPFVSDDLRDRLVAHMDNPDVHVSAVEKVFWNNKLNVDDNSEVVDYALILNRN